MHLTFLQFQHCSIFCSLFAQNTDPIIKPKIHSSSKGVAIHHSDAHVVRHNAAYFHYLA